ncbi:hypothetical protein D3C87_1379820 [compost metagenome]
MAGVDVPDRRVEQRHLITPEILTLGIGQFIGSIRANSKTLRPSGYEWSEMHQHSPLCNDNKRLIP